MKRLIVFLYFLNSLHFALAQDDSRADYLRNPVLPPFTLLKADSSKLTRDHLPEGRKTLIILFSVDCDHCRGLTDSLITNIDKLRHMEILMTTYQPLKDMADFMKEFNLDKYQNIKVGRDTRYFFIPFFEARSLPFLALYNEKGMLVNAFAGEVSIDSILSGFSAHQFKN